MRTKHMTIEELYELAWDVSTSMSHHDPRYIRLMKLITGRLRQQGAIQ